MRYDVHHDWKGGGILYIFSKYKEGTISKRVTLEKASHMTASYLNIPLYKKGEYNYYKD